MPELSENKELGSPSCLYLDLFDDFDILQVVIWLIKGSSVKIWFGLECEDANKCTDGHCFTTACRVGLLYS